MTDKKIILSTAGSREEARKIAHALVGARLAACVNIIPRIESVYRWKETVEAAEEWLLLIKTDIANVNRVGELIKDLHSYELPEWMVLEIEDGSTEYLNWIGKSVGSSSSE